jgi:large subunit ribosomal protein L12
MEYVYAALLLHESGEELNEDNITAVLESASVDVEQSRVKALVAALEDVDIEEALETAAAVPAAGGAAPAGGSDDGDDTDEAEADDGDDTDEAEADDGDDADEEASGEGLGNLFG